MSLAELLAPAVGSATLRDQATVVDNPSLLHQDPSLHCPHSTSPGMETPMGLIRVPSVSPSPGITACSAVICLLLPGHWGSPMVGTAGSVCPS